MNQQLPPIIDAHDLAEDRRITMIGDAVMVRLRVGVMVEHDSVAPGKADRYVRLLAERFPRVFEVSRTEHAPLKGVTTLTLGLKDA